MGKGVSQNPPVVEKIGKKSLSVHRKSLAKSDTHPPFFARRQIFII